MSNNIPTKTSWKKGHTPWNKGLKYKCKQYNLSEEAKLKRVENLGNRFKGLKHTEEWKKNQSKKFKGRKAVGGFFTKESRKHIILPKKDTTIEVKIQNFLKQLGIEYFTHQYMKIEHGYQCDILIPSMNMVIECDGNYWHKYPTGNDIDHIRTEELLKKGFKVLRLWEHEIREMNVNDFKEKLI